MVDLMVNDRRLSKGKLMCSLNLQPEGVTVENSAVSRLGQRDNNCITLQLAIRLWEVTIRVLSLEAHGAALKTD
jgi:hypothetical protein